MVLTGWALAATAGAAALVATAGAGAGAGAEISGVVLGGREMRSGLRSRSAALFLPPALGAPGSRDTSALDASRASADSASEGIACVGVGNGCTAPTDEAATKCAALVSRDNLSARPPPTSVIAQTSASNAALEWGFASGTGVGDFLPGNVEMTGNEPPLGVSA